jgi:hypothetical protein
MTVADFMSDSTTPRKKRRWLGMRPWFLVITLVLLGAVYWFFEGNPVYCLLTSYLPDCDRIEVELVHVNFESIDRVIATKTLTGPDTKQLQDIWRSQDYSYAGHVMCHAPAYRLRFYLKSKFLTEATVCFHCHNIYFYGSPNGDGSQSPFLDATFGALNDTNEKYVLFRDYMAGLFPGHNVEAESSQRPN